MFTLQNSREVTKGKTGWVAAAPKHYQIKEQIP